MAYTTAQIERMTKNAKAKTSERDELRGQHNGLLTAIKKKFGVESLEELKSLEDTVRKTQEHNESAFDDACEEHQALLDAAEDGASD